MKILFLSQEALWPTGIGTYTRHTARALAARGHDVHILTCVAQISEGDEIRDALSIHRRRRIRVRGLHRLYRVHPIRRLLRRPARREFPPWNSPALRINAAFSNYLHHRRLGIDFDVIEAPEHLAEGLILALLRDTPVIVQLHGPLRLAVRCWGYRPGWKLRISDRLERLAASRAMLAVAPSRLTVRELTKAGWPEARGARVVPHTIDPHTTDGFRWTAVRPVAQTRPLILAIGEVGWRKASDVLVRATANLTDRIQGIEVVFVGPSLLQPDGIDSRDAIADLAEALGVTCRFAGHVSRDELEAWYGEARVVAVPSRYDPFALVGLEAMACGRPVVCSTGTGLAEVAEAASGAISVVPVDDADALACALQGPLRDPSEAEELGRRGRAFVQLHWRKVAAHREAVYREAIDLRRHPSRMPSVGGPS
jgi:glycosyltransferase involved in cell wall biosynthesis